jgi:hypothetical protein
MQQQKQAMQEIEQLKGVMAQSGGDPHKAISSLLQHGTPRAIALAGQLKGLVEKPGVVPMTAHGLYEPTTGRVIPPLPAPPREFSPPETIVLQDRLRQLPPESPDRPRIEARLKYLTEREPRAEPAPHTTIIKMPSSSTGYGYYEWRSGKTIPEAPPPSSANAGVRIDMAAANQLQRQYNSSTNPWRDILGPVAVYRNARETGDTAQSTLMAAEALRRTARVGSQRFKGEVDTILGASYRGGSLVERIENFISQEVTGTPTRTTMQRLDKLIDAAETSSLEQIGNQARHYSGQAKGRNIPLQHVTGIPFIQGRKVVFPDGTFAEFKTSSEADASASKWLEANPIQK